ncbi:hypothetical protein HMPREF0578_1185 [Mobiluncus mulieris 28-1]|nr:hypothetical protein HMPREF0578_1185 [Mobiluncus mulieris 28-1]
MMNRKLRVKVNKHPDPDAVASAGMRRLPGRMLRKLTVQSGRCAVLLPGRDVQSIEIIDNDQATSSHKRRGPFADEDFESFMKAVFGPDQADEVA